MRGIFIWVGLFCIPWLVATGRGECSTPGSTEPPAKRQSLVQAWLAESDPFATLYVKLEKDFERFGQSERMVRSIFYRSHQHLLHAYRQYTLDWDVLTEGAYDCVSGSLILAGLLDHFSFSYEIIETSYHVFLQVALGDKQLLLEVTDPRSGYIDDSVRRKAYLNDYLGENGSKGLWREIKGEGPSAGPDIYQKISLHNLLGLQYFNQAIRYFNEGNPLAAYQFAETALKYHPSARIREFSHFLKQKLLLASK